jgi:hypothetical protein
MRRTSRLSRHAALPTRGRGKRFRGYVRDDAYQDWIRSLPCAVESPAMHDWLMGDIPTPYSCWGRIEAAHVISRGAGGQDAENLLPLCTRHHQEQHDTGVKSFAAKYGIWMSQMARALWDQYETSMGD